MRTSNLMLSNLLLSDLMLSNLMLLSCAVRLHVVELDTYTYISIYSKNCNGLGFCTHILALLVQQTGSLSYLIWLDQVNGFVSFVGIGAKIAACLLPVSLESQGDQIEQIFVSPANRRLSLENFSNSRVVDKA
jgi:hypothetical protein